MLEKIVRIWAPLCLPSSLLWLQLASQPCCLWTDRKMDNYPAQSKFTIRGRYKANFLGIFSPTNIDSSQSMGCRCPKSVDNELGGWGVNMSWSGEGTKIPALSSRPLLFRGLFSGQSSGLGVMGIYPEKTIIKKDPVYPNIHYSTIYNSQDREATWTSFNKRMDEDDVVHI